VTVRAQHGGTRLAGTPADTALLQRWQSASANWLAPVPDTQDVQRLLLQAFAVYLDRCDGGARLIVIDDGAAAPTIAALRNAIADGGCAAHIELLVDAGDACTKAALLSADALLSSGASLALLHEAMALGTPVVHVGGGPPEAGTALLWREPDAALLAASLERLRNDAALRALLRADGFACAQRMSTQVGCEVDA
jgi:glycosyltransferase involved in cell wall biosynthesis